MENAMKADVWSPTSLTLELLSRTVGPKECQGRFER
jgi:hypothetical protein